MPNDLIIPDRVAKLKKHKLDLKKKKLSGKYPNIYWAKYHHLNTKNAPMSFRNREFLLDIYKDAHSAKKVVIRKSVQCGISEAFVITHLQQAYRGMSIMYILPKTDIRNRFVNNRIDRTIAKVPYYRQILAMSTMKRSDSVALKMFGQGVVNYVASNSPANFTEYPADAIYYDEKDRMDQATILLAKDRISDSDFAYERIVSNPTVVEFGVSADYEQSSKGKRMFKCPHCNQWQEYDFFKNVVRETGRRMFEVLDRSYTREEMKKDISMYCYRCYKPVNRFAARSTWVHEWPQRESRGYHISKVFSPQGALKDLADRCVDSRMNETEFQIFMNSDLGRPMVGGLAQITREEIVASRGEYLCGANIQKHGVRYAGCDVGNDLHVIIREVRDGRKMLIYKGKVHDEQELVNLISVYGVDRMVIDALPEQRMVERLKEKTDRVHSCFFGSVKETHIDRKNRTITVRRTPVIDRVKGNYEHTVYLNPINMMDDKEYVEHMDSNVRIIDPDHGEFLWVQKQSRPDHYLLAEAYGDLAADMVIGSDYFSVYKQESERIDKEMGQSNVHSEMDDLPEAERKRLQEKSQMTTDDFFNQIRKQMAVDEVVDDIGGY